MILPLSKSSAVQSRRQFARFITYLHSGSRVRGLKRDPESYLKNPRGLAYNELNQTEIHDQIVQSLKLKECDIELPKEVILQCLTHKSFAHGSKPYNEKLCLLGTQFLKYQAAIHSLRQPQLLSPVAQGKIQQSINGLNFTNLGTQLSKLLISKPVAARFVKQRKLDALIFWKMKDPLKDSHHNGETTIYSTVLNAFVGAVLATNGPDKARQFVSKVLLDGESESSLVHIANEQVKELSSQT
ncbi:hypothetical protein HG537_0C03710 [Torulaspora globosa]|uniref:RNase III domain-containing protein n=1 Tax=Torulaspora globosa TaxID=48254 RepID=A0A7H9HR07_9SACH|nr:hypothetical protein HG537_0C03710 [Torulaspora sp. CBS 2947]